MAKIVLHLKKGDVSSDLNGWHLRLYRTIRDMCAADGIVCEIRGRDIDLKVGTRQVSDGRFGDGNLHIVDDRSIKAPGVLNAGVAYFWEYWHLDPVGIKAFSSIGRETFHPDTVDSERADILFANLRKRYADRRESKYQQTKAVMPVPAGAISVFFQGQYPLNAGATQFSDIEMLLAVMEHGGDRPIVVKPHPFAATDLDVEMARKLARKDRRICMTDANVHDILEKSIATVSINSTVALEGFLHRVPAVLFGKSDFHHFATTITASLNFDAALKTELSRRSGYEQYLAWYFLKHCIPINSRRIHQRIWDRFALAGFPKDAFR